MKNIMLPCALVALTMGDSMETPPAEYPAALTEKQKDIPVMNDSNMGDLFDMYRKRVTVILEEDDFKTLAPNMQGPEQTGLLACSHYFFDKFQEDKDRFAILLLNTTEKEMIEDAEAYLNCKQRPCYSIEIEDDNDGAKAYTLSMKDFGFTKASGHDFASSCRQFVDRYLDESNKGSITWYRNPAEETDIDDDHHDDKEDEDASTPDYEADDERNGGLI